LTVLDVLNAVDRCIEYRELSFANPCISGSPISRAIERRDLSLIHAVSSTFVKGQVQIFKDCKYNNRAILSIRSETGLICQGKIDLSPLFQINKDYVAIKEVKWMYRFSEHAPKVLCN